MPFSLSPVSSVVAKHICPSIRMPAAKYRRVLTRESSRDSSIHDGPATAAALWDYPFQILARITRSGRDSERVANLKAWCDCGVYGLTDFSGFDCPGEAMRLVKAVLEEEFSISMPEESFSIHRSCDSGPMQRTALLALNNRQCVFGNVDSRLPEDVRKELDALEPPKNATVNMKVEAYREMQNYLLRNRKTLFSKKARSWCFRCKRMCPTGFLPKPAGQHTNPLHVNVSGTVCTPYSTCGKRQKNADGAERGHCVWLAERIAFAEREVEDLSFSENVYGYDMRSRLANPLAGTHLHFSVYIDSAECAWPARRPRAFSANLNVRTLGWTGPFECCSASPSPTQVLYRFPNIVVCMGFGSFSGPVISRV